MRKIITLLFTFICALQVSAYQSTPLITLSGSQTELTPVYVTPGGSDVVYLYVEGVEGLNAFEANLFLPNGITIKKKANANLTKNEDGEATHSVSFADCGADGWKILVYSSDLTTFNGNKGSLAKLTLSADANFSGGEYYFKNIIFADPASLKIEIVESEHGLFNDIPLVPVSSITLDKNNTEVTVGHSITLKATVSPSNSRQTLNWSSSNTDVATVSGGVVRGVSVGTATIKAEATDGSGVYATCTITVKEYVPPVYDLLLTLSGSETELTPVYIQAGESAIAYVYVEGVEGLTAFEANLFLPNELSIKKKANANLTKDENDRVTHSITYDDQGADGWKILIYSTDLTTFNGNKGSLAKLTLSADANFTGGEYYFKNIIFADPASQKIEIVESEHGLFNDIPLVPVSSITLDKNNAEVTVGHSITLKATVSPSNSRQTLNWSSSNTDVATVSDGGIVRGVSAGTATIKAEATDGSGVYATCTITVKEYVPPVYDNILITLSGSEKELTPVYIPAGESAVAYVYVEGVEDFTAFEANLILPNGLSIKKKANANLTKDEDGESTHSISYADQGADGWKLLIYSSYYSTFNGNKGSLAKLTLSADKNFISGEYYYKSIIFADPESQKIEIAESDHGQINSPALVPVSSITLDRTTAEVSRGLTIKLHATVLPENSNHILAWYSSNPNIATVIDGVVRGISVGTATIKAEATDGSGKYATCVVTVKNYTKPEVFITLSGSENEITPVYVPTGGTANAYIYVKGVESLTSCEASLVLPYSISIIGKAASILTKDDDDEPTHSCSYANRGNGEWKLLIFDTDLRTFNGNEGAIMKLKLFANSYFYGGNFYFKDVIFSDPGSTKTENIKIEQGVINNFPLAPGDVNQDGVVDVADMTSTISLIVDEYTSGLSFWAADLDKDGMILVNDLKEVTDLVLEANPFAKPEMAKGEDLGISGNDIALKNDYLAKGIETEMDLVLNSNCEDYTGLQFDLTLPEGVTLNEVRLGNGAINHDIAQLDKEDGTIRVVAYSMGNKTFTNSQVLKLALTADDMMSDGEYEVLLNNVAVSTPMCQSVRLSDCKTTVSIGEANGIDEIAASSRDQNTGTKFNLQGLKVGDNYKGIVISNGKKYLKK